jgi:3-deoxy-manno-octulosonate cytidylyltransferase (CMP-KDO synthetase)
MKIIAVIPAHMASVRFPRKILYPFHGVPMIEHVRRRAEFSGCFDEIYVATCDEEIKLAVEEAGGKVIITGHQHKNGTTRVAEAIDAVDCSHVVLLQGDEPLLLPRHIESLVGAIRHTPEGDAWNATGPIESEEELDRHSFVKCAITANGRIMYCFRRSPCYSELEVQQKFVRKILGMIAFKKEFLLELVKAKPSMVETVEFIEQMRIIEIGGQLSSVAVEPSLPSVNEPSEEQIVLDYIEADREQRELLTRVLEY